MKTLLSLTLLITLLSACGAELAYKRGASSRDLQASKVACQAAKNEVALKQCLEDSGWAVQKLGEKWLSDDDLFATASAGEGNIMQKPKQENIKTTDSIQVDPVATPQQKMPATQAKAVVNTADTRKLEHQDTTKQHAVIKTQPKPTTKPKPQLLDTYVIKSWWKMGAGAALLEQHMDECSTTLGAAHQPNKKTFTFTRGFAICMREKGWRGLIEK